LCHRETRAYGNEKLRNHAFGLHDHLNVKSRGVKTIPWMPGRVSAFWRDVAEWGRQEQVESLPRQQNIQEDKPGVGRRPTPMAMGYSLETYRRAPPLLFTKGKS